MQRISGYLIFEKIHESPHAVLYRGSRESDGQKLVFKMINAEYPDLREVERLKREFHIIKRLKVAGVITALGLERHKNSPVLILEDFGGKSLDNIAGLYLNQTAKFLDLAIQLATILGELHKNKIIHKNIKPSNILVNEETNTVKIIDFRFASVLEKENQLLKSPRLLEGSYEYMSPEQTGRINRAIDYRTDYYSLGVTFYELLCGRRPFISEDPIELLHAHIAKQPISPDDVNPNIPRAIGFIVMKLLRKDAEERYQSIYGLVTDLNKCRSGINNNQTIPSFIPGEADIPDRLQIPQKIYGRQKELDILLASFARIAEGSTEMIAVSGFSGIGKTTLIKDIQKIIIKKNGYFAGGKFDQFNRNIPYASIIQAFKELVRQLLTETDDRIVYWKNELRNALGQNGQLIINVIHELELLIGSQPPVSELGPADAQNRFNILFQSFVKVFAAPQHPLVLFLDDLQWADARSLQIIELLADGIKNNCLLICSYRNNEVSEEHPLKTVLKEIKEKNVPVTELLLQSLSENDISALVSDTFYCSAEKAKPLAEILMKKTDGNPFFTNEFIHALYAEKVIEFENSRGIWLWDIPRINDMKITDNVIELMVSKIKKLPDQVQQLLRLAACLGNHFELKELAGVMKQPRHKIAQDLMPAITDGLIIPLGDDYKLFQHTTAETAVVHAENTSAEYKFIHDRVQQAAYSLIENDKKKEVHLSIGRLLLSDADIESNRTKIFEIVNHLNYGSSLITEIKEKKALAGLNLAAGKKAKFTSAFHTALKYFISGTSLLDAESWNTDYGLAYALFLELAECEHLCGNVENAENIFDLVLSNAKSNTDRAKVFEKKIHFYSNLSEFRASYEAARSALKIFKIHLPSPAQAKPMLVYEFIKSKIKLRGRKINDLIHLPAIKEGKYKLAIKIISAALKSAYQIAPELCVANAIKTVNYTLQYGHAEDNAIAFIVFGGIFQGGILGKHQTGYEYGKLALGLNEAFSFVAQKSEVNFVFAYFSNSWKNPLKNTENYYKNAIEAGLATGDFFHIGCASSALCQNLLMRGVSLDKVYAATEKYIDLVKRVQNKEAEKTILGIQQAVLNLKGIPKSPQSFNDERFDEDAYMQALTHFGSQHFAHFYYVNKMQSLFLMGEYRHAFDIAKKSGQFLKYSIGMFHMTEHYFYSSLILCALYQTSDNNERKKLLKQLKKNLGKFEKWASECPKNFQHKYLLVKAGISRINGGAPYELYTEAIEAARENEFLQDEAIASELAAAYQLSRNNNDAYTLLSDSYYLFRKWGAHEKIAKMKKEYNKAFGFAATQ